MGAHNNGTLVEVLARVRHSAGIELIILTKKNLCSGEIKGVRKFSEKELPILKKPRLIKSFLYTDLFSTQRNLLFQIISFRTSCDELGFFPFRSDHASRHSNAGVLDNPHTFSGYYKITNNNYNNLFRDWSKSIGGGGGPEQRGGGSSVFEPLIRGGSCNF